MVGKKGIFGSTADRFFSSQFTGSKSSVNGNYDQRNYDPEDHSGQRDDFSRRPTMDSTSKRFLDDEDLDPPISTDSPAQTTRTKIHLPGPTHYTPEMDIDYRSPFRHARTEHLSFGSGKPRFDPKDCFYGILHNSNRPGPGDYNTGEEIILDENNNNNNKKCLSSKKKVKGGSCTQARRLLSTVPIGSTLKDVGPGSYEVTGTMMKKTFNVT